MLPVTVGNKFVGYIDISKDYVSVPVDPSDDYKSAVSYKTTDDTTSISMYAIITDGTTEDFVQTWVSQSTMNPVVSQEMINGLSVTMITEQNESAGITSLAIIFDNVLQDEYVHVVTIDSTVLSETEMRQIISTYTIID